MGDCWQHPDLERMQDGMLLLGWRADSRFTSEDEAQLTPLVEEAIRLKEGGKLGADEIEPVNGLHERVGHIKFWGENIPMRMRQRGEGEKRLACRFIAQRARWTMRPPRNVQRFQAMGE